MPTITTPTHRLAALIAVERQANVSLEARRIEADQAFSEWTRSIHDGVLKQASRDADAARDAAVRALVTAQVETDQALGSLSVARDGVMPTSL